MTSYIKPDQTGFIPKWDLIDKSHKYRQQKKGRLALDVEKALDSLEIPYIKTLLTKMGCGTSILKIIDILFNKPIVTILANGMSSNDFPTVRGTHHGCLLPPLVFALCIDPPVEAI